MDNLTTWKEKFADSITSRGRKPAKTTIKNHYTQLRKINLSGTKEEVMQRMKAVIKDNNNPKHIVDAFKSYIKVIYADEFEDNKKLEEFTDQLGKFHQLPRNEAKLSKKRSILRKTQIEFVNSLPESSLDKLRMKCLAMAQLSSSRRYKDIVNCRINEFGISENGKGYRLHLLHSKGEKVSKAILQNKVAEMITKLIQTIVHTKNRKVKNNPFIFIPDQFIHSDYTDLLAPLDYDSYTTYYEAYKRYIIKYSSQFKRLNIEITPHDLRAWAITHFYRISGNDIKKTKAYSNHSSESALYPYIQDEEEEEAYKDIDLEEI